MREKMHVGDRALFNPKGYGIFINDDMKQAHAKDPELIIVKLLSNGSYRCHSPHFTDGHNVFYKDERVFAWDYTPSYLTPLDKQDLVTLRNEKHITDQQFLERRAYQLREG